MKLKDGRITFLISQESTTIQLKDNESSITFAEIVLTPEELSSALSRLSFTTCKIELHGLDKVGKKMETGSHIFEIQESIRGTKFEGELYALAKTTCPKGWEPDCYFGSQNSFFSDNGRQYARVTIRRWVIAE